MHDILSFFYKCFKNVSPCGIPSATVQIRWEKGMSCVLCTALAGEKSNYSRFN